MWGRIRYLRAVLNLTVLPSHPGLSGPPALQLVEEGRGRRQENVCMEGMPSTTTVWSSWKYPNLAGKRFAQSTLSGRNGLSALGRVVGEPRRESESAFRAVQRLVRGWDPLKRLRIATQASALLGQTGPSGRLAPRLVEVAARGGRELVWQLELWEVSSVQDLVRLTYLFHETFMTGYMHKAHLNN